MKSLKYRLLGALILVILAVVFVPILLDLSDPAAVTRPPLAASLGMPSAPSMAATTKASDSSIEQSTEIDHLVPAWEIRLKGFNERALAEALQTRLRAQGFLAYVKFLAREAQPYWVYVGPEYEQAEVDKQQQAIAQQFHIKGRVLLFKVVPFPTFERG